MFDQGQLDGSEAREHSDALHVKSQGTAGRVRCRVRSARRAPGRAGAAGDDEGDSRGRHQRAHQPTRDL